MDISLPGVIDGVDVAITPPILGAKFVEILKKWLHASEWDEVLRRNLLEADENICHSHDFIDSNMAMDEAMHQLGVKHEGDPDHDGWGALWNAAWAWARDHHLRALPGQLWGVFLRRGNEYHPGMHAWESRGAAIQHLRSTCYDLANIRPDKDILDIMVADDPTTGHMTITIKRPDSDRAVIHAGVFPMGVIRAA